MPAGHAWIPRTRTSVGLTEANARLIRCPTGRKGRTIDAYLRERAARHPGFPLR